MNKELTLCPICYMYSEDDQLLEKHCEDHHPHISHIIHDEIMVKDLTAFEESGDMAKLLLGGYTNNE